MVFIRSKFHQNKKKGPRVYYFLVKNYRIKGKKTPKQAVIQFLGRYEKEPSKSRFLEAFPKYKNEIEEYFVKREKRAAEGLEKAKTMLHSAKKKLEEVGKGYDEKLSS
ncbi:MAG: hypothetical protein AABX74_05385 [Nanoarchaeota archaeon]